jgi:hypothetical protein
MVDVALDSSSISMERPTTIYILYFFLSIKPFATFAEFKGEGDINSEALLSTVQG